jgi:hypothetical protein
MTGIMACPACGGDNYVELPGNAVPRPRPDRAPLVVLLGVLAMVAVMMAGAVVAVVLVFRQARHKADIDDVDPAPYPPTLPGPRHPPTPSAPEIVSWVGSGGSMPPCLADADGDGAPDVVGFGVAGGGQALMAVSARSGHVLWQNADLPTSTALWCDGHGGAVLLNGADFTASGIDVKSGHRVWSTKLRDKPEAVAFGERCLSALASDKSVTTLALATGAPAPCPSAPAPKPRWETQREPVTAKGLTFAFSTVRPGSPRIIVKASKGGREAWSQTLAIASDSPWTPPHALRASALLVAGQKPGTQDMGVVMLDVATGAVLAAHDIHQKEAHPGVFVRLATSERHAFLETFGKLYALRMPELDVAWEAGSMW